MDYTVILKVPGQWSDVYVASVKHEPHSLDSMHIVHNAIVALAKAQLKAQDPKVRMRDVKVLLTFKGHAEIMYFGWQPGIN